MADTEEQVYGSTRSGEGERGGLIPPTGMVASAAALTAATVGAGLFWLATWMIYDHGVSLPDTVATALVETSRGLFVGAGLLAVAVVLRLVERVEGWLAVRRDRR